MPELPEVETTKNSLEPLLNKYVSNIRVYQPKLRWQIPDDLYILKGYQLTSIKRRAKYLVLSFSKILETEESYTKESPKQGKNYQTQDIILHLGMSGSLQQFEEGSEKRKHDHLIIDFQDNTKNIIQLHYHDPRRFGSILWAQDNNNYEKKLLGHLGVEPLTDNFSEEYLYNYIHKKQKKSITRPIKSVIMEQKIVVGVGNIYATESLFLSGLNPNTPANLISKQEIKILVQHIKSILSIAIEKGGSSLRDFTVSGNTKTGYFQQTLLVYGKEGKQCPNCSDILKNQKINGRASVFCSICQPLII